MIDQYGLVTKLTSDSISDGSRARDLAEFASEFGWRPSDELHAPELQDFANAHLLVEHGLEISAVITFLKSPWRFSDLGTLERRRLYSISYNNLVDWHIHVQPDEVLFAYNRTEQPTVVARASISRSDYDQLRSEAFEKVTGKRPGANLPALDDALIRTISLWRRQLSTELGYEVSNDTLSVLFNSIIFARAAEDQARRARALQRAHEGDGAHVERALLHAWEESGSLSLRRVLSETLQDLVSGQIPSYVIDEHKLSEFDGLDNRTVFALLRDFYRNRFASYYEYDFSIISKHALSRIYESYVSILRRVDDSPQASLFPQLPETERDRTFGSVYTPQYIARFFARYLKENTTPAVFQQLKVCDPACGSGIFLRTLLELQAEPLLEEFDTAVLNDLFRNVTGSDVDETAAQAARLSLALLYLVLANKYPGKLDVFSAEAIEYYSEHLELRGTYDAVIANPPFVALDRQSPEMRARISEYMMGDATGRIDMYLPFLKIALDLIKPGGFGLFVLPHSFLLKKSARGMRQLLSETTWIRFVADLSSIRVFGDVGSYVVLVIFQKKLSDVADEEIATVVRSQEFPGQALEDAVQGHTVQNSFYSIYQVGQDGFGAEEWTLAPPTQLALRRKIGLLPTLDKFLFARQGVVTGADHVFILPGAEVPEEDRAVYVPFLPDRRMGIYNVPEQVDQFLFYPYIGGKKLSEEHLRADFPSTWNYLELNRTELEHRSSLEKYNRAWWEPMWPRSPNLLQPKLVSPHLILVPRFSYDRAGQYAISRSPFLYPKIAGADDDLLLFFLAVLNSSVFNWYMAAQSHRYRGGYLMLELKTLRNVPVPDPTRLDQQQMRELISLVEERLISHGSRALDLDEEIDEAVSAMYGLTAQERQAFVDGS